MPDDFPYDVFLSHSAKDKAVARDIVERCGRGSPKRFAPCSRAQAEKHSPA
jgi:hypothetical protein